MDRVSNYPPKFRDQAGVLVLKGNIGVRDVVRALVSRYKTLGDWVTNARRGRAAGSAALSSDERLELARLRRKVTELEVEKGVLLIAAVVIV